MTTVCGRVAHSLSALALVGALSTSVGAASAEGEQSVRAYLAMWSRDDGVTAATIERFYAPRVVYYGKSMSRSQLLADKTAYIRQWPTRSYAEVPGSLTGHCNTDRSLCKVQVEMRWRRVDRNFRVATGRARLSFDFAPVEGGNKIVRESAKFL